MSGMIAGATDGEGEPNAAAQSHPATFNRSAMAKDIQAKFELLVSSERCNGSGITSRGDDVPVTNAQASSQVAGITPSSAVSTGGEALMLSAQSDPESAALGESNANRVVLDRWTLAMQEDETGALGLYVGGYVVGAVGDGRVICNAPVCQRRASHELELEDGTQVSLCGAPDTEEMEDAGSFWLVSLVLNGLPADWEEQLQDILQQEAEGAREGESRQTASDVVEPTVVCTSGDGESNGQHPNPTGEEGGGTPGEDAEVDLQASHGQQLTPEDPSPNPEDSTLTMPRTQQTPGPRSERVLRSSPGCTARRAVQDGMSSLSGQQEQEAVPDGHKTSSGPKRAPAVPARYSTRSASTAVGCQAAAQHHPATAPIARDKSRSKATKPQPGKPAGSGKLKDGAVLTTRSGRACLAPLEFWRNERAQRGGLEADSLGFSAELTPRKAIKAPKIKLAPKNPIQGSKKFAGPNRGTQVAAAAPDESRRMKRAGTGPASDRQQPRKQRRTGQEAAGSSRQQKQGKQAAQDQETTGAGTQQRSSYVRNVIDRVRESKSAVGPSGTKPAGVRHPRSNVDKAGAVDDSVIFQRPRRAAASAAASCITKCVTGKDPNASATATACEDVLRERAEEAAEAKRTARSAARAAAMASGPRPRVKAQKQKKKSPASDNALVEDTEQPKPRASRAHKQLSARDIGLGVKAPRMKGQGANNRCRDDQQLHAVSSDGITEAAAVIAGEHTDDPPQDTNTETGPGDRPEVPAVAEESGDCDDDGWTQIEVDSLQQAWASTDPLHPNFWAAVSKAIPGRTAAECFNKYMNKHGPSPVIHSSKPRRYLATLQQATAAVRGGANGKPTKAQTRKLVRHMRWQQRASELNLNMNEEAAASVASAPLTGETSGVEDSHQGFLAAMGRQERTDQYIEGILRRQRKAQLAIRAKGKAPQARTDHDQRKISRLEMQIQEALAAVSSGEDDDDEEEEADYYFSDEEAGPSRGALPSTLGLAAVKLSKSAAKK